MAFAKIHAAVSRRTTGAFSSEKSLIGNVYVGRGDEVGCRHEAPGPEQPVFAKNRVHNLLRTVDE